MKFFLSSHVIIAGLGRRGTILAEDLCRKGQKVVVIERAPTSAGVALADRLRFTLVTGDAAAPETLREAGIEKAAILLALCDEDNTNIEVALLAHALRGEAGTGLNPLECHVHIYDSRLRQALRSYGMDRLHTGVRLHYFNVFEETARRLARLYPLHDDRLTEPDLEEHFIVVGFGHFGQQVVLKFARLGHLPNGRPPRFTIIDPAATQNGRRFLQQYPEIENLSSLVFRDLATTDPEMIELSFLGAASPVVRETPVICVDNDPLCFATAIDLLPACARRQIPRIWTRLAKQEGVSRLFGNAGTDLQLRRIRPFGSLREVLRGSAVLDDSMERLAREYHALYCRGEGEKGKVVDENSSMELWDKLPEDLRSSNRELADHAHIKVRTLGYRLQPVGKDASASFEPTAGEIEILARVEHARWMADKQLAGWRYGEVRNPELKFHECLVHYDELTEETKDKDRATVRDLREVVAAAGFRIAPQEA